MDGLNFFTNSLLSYNFLDGEISGSFLVMNKTRKWNIEGFGCKFHVHKNLVDVDIIGLDDVGVSRIADDILFDFTHSHHGIVEHLLH